MAELIKPTRKELSYHQKFHTDSKTMSFQNHIDTYTQQDLDNLMDRITQDNPNHIFRLVFCDDCMDFVAETEWKYNIEKDYYEWNVLVPHDLRQVGYGHETLRLMKIEAKKYNIPAFYTTITKDNTVARLFLTFENFQCIETTTHTEVYRLELL